MMRLIIIILGLITFLSSCDKVRLVVDNSQVLHGVYTNYEGEGPKFVIDEKKTSTYLQYGSPSISQTPDNIHIGIPGIGISTNANNFSIDSVIIKERSGSGWEKEAEFSAASAFVKTKMQVVLVLDMSTSLGTNVENVKQYAKDFARQIINSSPESQVGLVLFSKDIDPFPFTSNLNTIESVINSYSKYGDRTTLYGATLKGLEMLDNSAFDGVKGLVVFTDGGDNNTNAPTLAKQAIIDSKTLRYSIGFDGGDLDKSAIKELATRKSNYTFANSTDDLEKAFSKVANEIQSIYYFKYSRSTQTFVKGTDEPIEIKFIFKSSKL
ncbi:MAG: VWA domain-containing protein [Bacteroidota bacterium]|nr:VWA domain-containing protein [Bacteroidota bacterium]